MSKYYIDYYDDQLDLTLIGGAKKNNENLRYFFLYMGLLQILRHTYHEFSRFRLTCLMALVP